MNLPDRWYALYYVVRPFRLALKYARGAATLGPFRRQMTRTAAATTRGPAQP